MCLHVIPKPLSVPNNGSVIKGKAVGLAHTLLAFNRKPCGLPLLQSDSTGKHGKKEVHAKKILSDSQLLIVPNYFFFALIPSSNIIKL